MTEGIKIATIGGGSSYTPELIEGFLRRYDSLPCEGAVARGRPGRAGEAGNRGRAGEKNGEKSGSPHEDYHDTGQEGGLKGGPIS